VKPIVSFLIPTRKRPDQLHQTIRSIIDMASDPTTVEIIVRADEDDEATLTMLNNTPLPIIFGVGRRPPLGYIQIADLYGEMASHSTGEFLFIFNDDTDMVSKGYDDILREYSMSVCILHCASDTTNTNEFPVVHRAIPSVCGNMGKHPSVDRWYQIMGEYMNITVEEPRIRVRHNKTNAPSEHDKDGLPTWNPEGVYDMKAQIHADADKVIAYFQADEDEHSS
jgi:glycosyltransferase involved in cell wall biosynthesis